ncbi:hypothetical protein HYS48_04925 [Candidatus Woesearchaeota archaeon]|nr:hypothetical protein [Candidatus Woesearchaeota archaeon]
MEGSRQVRDSQEYGELAAQLRDAGPIGALAAIGALEETVLREMGRPVSNGEVLRTNFVLLEERRGLQIATGYSILLAVGIGLGKLSYPAEDGAGGFLVLPEEENPSRDQLLRARKKEERPYSLTASLRLKVPTFADENYLRDEGGINNLVGLEYALVYREGNSEPRTVEGVIYLKLDTDIFVRLPFQIKGENVLARFRINASTMKKPREEENQ